MPLAVYDNISLTRGALTSSALAVHAAVLAANGKMEDAKSEAEQIALSSYYLKNVSSSQTYRGNNH